MEEDLGGFEGGGLLWSRGRVRGRVRVVVTMVEVGFRVAVG